MTKRLITSLLLYSIFSLTTARAQTPVHPRLSREVLGDIVKSIPSPLEISFLIKDLGIQYDKTLLNLPEKAQHYKSEFAQALNLGLYATDVGYANMYEQNKSVLGGLKAIEEMAKGLKVTPYYDFEKLRKLGTQSNKFDSLLLETNTILEKINEYFYKKKKSYLTILMLTGGWIESLYITCVIGKKSPNELLNNRIGEQKIILEQLLLLLSFYESNAKVLNLITELNKLQGVYDKVKIDFQYNDPVTKQDKNGILIIDNNTSTKINFTKKDLEGILKTSKDIRAMIISLK